MIGAIRWPDGQRIALINCISERGHLDAYARIYARAIVELGYRVVLIAPSEGGVTSYLQRAVPEKAHRFSYLPRHSEAPESGVVPASRNRAALPIWERAALVWQEEGLIGVMQRVYAASFQVFLRKMVLATAAFRIWQRSASKIPFASSLGSAARGNRAGSEKIDLCFHLYLDFMSEKRRDLAALTGEKTIPWAGILFHPRLLGHPRAAMEAYFRANSARGAVFLVPGAGCLYSERLPQLRFYTVPDVADLECCSNRTGLAEEVRRRAGRRVLVLCVGSITAHKSIVDLIRVIEIADMKRFFFALVGEVHWESFNADRDIVKAFYAKPPENVFLHEGYIEDERDYNDIVLACDIIYAVYKEFYSSSNSLTKSAGLRRRILVAESTLMGQRVLASRIGAVAAEGSPAKIYAALCTLAERPESDFGFDEYAAEHSLEALKAVLVRAIPEWLKTGGAPVQCGKDPT